MERRYVLRTCVLWEKLRIAGSWRFKCLSHNLFVFLLPKMHLVKEGNYPIDKKRQGQFYRASQILDNLAVLASGEVFMIVWTPHVASFCLLTSASFWSKTDSCCSDQHNFLCFHLLLMYWLEFQTVQCLNLEAKTKSNLWDLGSRYNPSSIFYSKSTIIKSYYPLFSQGYKKF